MRIQNNMLAMNTQRMMNLNSNATGKVLEKLSSGFRINRAGDDAAGLVISEKMRAQIRGLNQASRNSQDAISLIQTAEGATAEVHEILQRMRQLTIQSANDTNVSADRDAMQSEIDQLITEVDRIATTTEFNGISLLDGSGSGPSISQATIDAISAALPEYLNDAMTVIQSRFDLLAPAGVRNMDITYYYDDTTTTGASMGTVDSGANLTLRVNLAGVTDASGNLKSTDIVDTLIAHEMMHAYQYTNLPFVFDGATTAAEGWFLEGLSMAVQGGNFFPVTDHNIAAGGFDGDYRSAFEGVKVMHELINGGLDALLDQLEGGLSIDAAIAAVTWNAGGTDIGTADGAHTVASIVDLESFRNYFNDSTDVDTFLGRTGAGQEFDPTVSGVITDATAKGSTSTLSLADTIPNGTGTALVNANFTLNFTNPNFAGSGGILSMQVGANETQEFSIQLGNVTASNLGIDNVDISTRSDAESSIKFLDDAIETVSNIRSRFGAYQNRLEHTIKNLDNTSENLTSAESRIRDFDMAKGMMTFSKVNILSQAAQAMLSQANNAPQSVLQLLR
ncbi:MAG: hypothetical protein JXR88_03235 [Clostridia bacterium]|nr:hypothetical protein [Clostridia bacterium]